MLTQRVVLGREGAVATICLNRPEAMNALDIDMAEALVAAIEQCASDSSVRVVVLTGAGKSFMAGGDIKWFTSGMGEDDAARRAMINRTIETIHRGIEAIARMDQPVIARVQGAAAGFGLSLMAACDLAICADDTVFSLAYIKIGASPDGGSTYSLPRAIGVKRTMELALLGDRFGAAEAVAMGLVNRSVPPEKLENEAGDIARRLAVGPRGALARTKRLVRESLNATLRGQLDAERDAFIEGFVGDEFAEGTAAFLEKRKPRFAPG